MTDTEISGIFVVFGILMITAFNTWQGYQNRRSINAVVDALIKWKLKEAEELIRKATKGGNGNGDNIA